MRQRIGLVLAGLEAVLVERTGGWARTVTHSRPQLRQRLWARLLLWLPTAAASLAVGYALTLAGH